jgi:hypothetical protein
MKTCLTIFFAFLLVDAFTGCQSDQTGSDPRITGDTGVRIKSRDTSRIVPGS